MKTEKTEWYLSHTMPAFVGDATQSAAQWRIPSFKGALRHWWRIVVSGSEPRLTWEEMLEREGKLFGQVLAEADRASKSRVRLSLAEPPAALANQWPTDIKKMRSGKFSVPAELYLGYGALLNSGGKAVPRYKRWIAPDAKVQLLIQFPSTDCTELTRALGAMHHFGAMGNRSRRSWGSITLVDELNAPAVSFETLIASCSIDLDTALQREWANGIVNDNNGPLIWDSKPLPSWQACVADLGQHLKALNSNLRAFEKAGKGTLATLGGIKPRWSSLLRMKVCATPDGLVLRLIFLPCKVSSAVKGLTLERKHCQRLIEHLDEQSGLFRIQTGVTA